MREHFPRDVGPKYEQDAGQHGAIVHRLSRRMALARRAASSDPAMLLVGETRGGKERFARALV
nr:hypothetical protein [Paraburkholderia xenovorans]